MDKKQYIVTYDKDECDAEYAAKVLSRNTDSMEYGVSVLGASEEPSPETILHFDEIGVSVLGLDDNEVKNLIENENVVDVIEDIDVFAFDDIYEQNFGDTSELDDYSRNQLVQEGYLQALRDIGLSFGHNFPGRDFYKPLPPDMVPWPTGPVFPPYFWPGRGFPADRLPNISDIARFDAQDLIQWNIRSVNADKAWYRTRGQNVNVAIIDTGIDGNHRDLVVSGGASFVPGVGSWNDDQGHGTHCAGITAARKNGGGIIGVAPECNVFAVKVLDSQGRGKLSWILAGMSWAERNKIDVASMSLGSNVSNPNEPCPTSYKRAASRLNARGCIIIAAAGNNGERVNHWVGIPARCNDIMAVAAVDSNNRKASFSSWGPDNLGTSEGIEISAPGVSINSTMPNNNYRKASGTSMACPHVSGAAALLKSMYPGASPDAIRRQLRRTAKDLGKPADDPQYGSGLLDCYAAVTTTL